MAPTLIRRLEQALGTDISYLARSGLWMNLHVLIVTLVSFLLALVFANYLPQEVYGRYQYLLSFTAILGAFTMTGMNYAITQAVARGHEGMVRRAVVLQLSWGALPACLGLLVATPFVLQGDLELAAGIAFTGVLVPITNAFNTYLALLNGRKMFRSAFFSNAIVSGAYFVSMLFTVFFFKSALILLVVNLSVSALVLFFLYRHVIRAYPPNESDDPETIPYGKQLSLSYAYSLVIRQLDTIIVFHVLGPISLAVYSIASAIPERIAGLFRFLFTASLPKFSAQSREQIQHTLAPRMVKVALVGLLTAGVYTIASPYIFHYLFPLYLESLPLSQVYSLILISVAANLSVSALLSQRLKTELHLFNTIMPTIQLVLQLVLIFPFGLLGVLWARIASAVLELVVSAALLKAPVTSRT